MSKPIVLSVESVSKSYRIGLSGGQPQGLRHMLEERVRSAFQIFSRNKKTNESSSKGLTEEFWALNDISFQVRQGEVLGVIGRNGAGKSTLLKVLSRITEPTHGRVRISGRISSLLEVGTGFHPELTGRENIYLNGTILGMNRKEIRRKFDEIVAFSEIEKFIDTPVKRYSSGMYVRLAFAVAAHLEPEILIIDEVLAVGDAQFQKKCLGKMKAVSGEGRTVLFVSHSMPTITSLCSRAILLDGGRIVAEGNPSDVVVHYYSEGGHSPASVDFTGEGKKRLKGPHPLGDDYAELHYGAVENEEGKPSAEIDIMRPLKVRMRYRVLQKNQICAAPNFHFFSSDGVCVFVSFPEKVEVLEPGIYDAVCSIPGNFLNEGVYFVGLSLSSYETGTRVHIWQPNGLSFNVRDPVEGSVTRGGYQGRMPGLVRPCFDWKIKPTDSQ
ncbi:MAG: ABC transporter ATP-binding protein [Verrucomicrobiota bacterium]